MHHLLAFVFCNLTQGTMILHLLTGVFGHYLAGPTGAAPLGDVLAGAGRLRGLAANHLRVRGCPGVFTGVRGCVGTVTEGFWDGGGPHLDE
jgi:hypothetical protein